jgi:hypothetical protein
MNLKPGKFCSGLLHFLQFTVILLTLLIMTLIIMKILMILNMGDITYN